MQHEHVPARHAARDLTARGRLTRTGAYGNWYRLVSGGGFGAAGGRIRRPDTRRLPGGSCRTRLSRDRHRAARGTCASCRCLRSWRRTPDGIARVPTRAPGRLDRGGPRRAGCLVEPVGGGGGWLWRAVALGVVVAPIPGFLT